MALAGVWVRSLTRPGEGVEGSRVGQVGKASVSRKYRERWGRRDMETESEVSSKVIWDHAEMRDWFGQTGGPCWESSRLGGSWHPWKSLFWSPYLGGLCGQKSPHDRPGLCKPPLLVDCLGAGPSGGALSDSQGFGMESKRFLDKL